MDDVQVEQKCVRWWPRWPPAPRARRAWRCWVICTVTGLLDAITTWYGIRVVHLPESNPLARSGIEHLGLGATLVLRVVVGCAAVGLAALGASGRLPREPQFAVYACWLLLVLAIMLWGVVVINNVVEITQHQAVT
jgi:hypothetical protein